METSTLLVDGHRNYHRIYNPMLNKKVTMKNIYKLLLAGTVFLFPFVAKAQGEPALRISVMNPTFRVEYGDTLFHVDDLFNQPWADFKVWAGAGSTVTNGMLSGSFSGLWQVPNFSKGIDLNLGIEYRAIQGERPAFDFVAHFTVGKNQSVGVSTRGLVYWKKF